jgi:hypothetical protein
VRPIIPANGQRIVYIQRADSASCVHADQLVVTIHTQSADKSGLEHIQMRDKVFMQFLVPDHILFIESHNMMQFFLIEVCSIDLGLVNLTDEALLDGALNVGAFLELFFIVRVEVLLDECVESDMDERAFVVSEDQFVVVVGGVEEDLLDEERRCFGLLRGLFCGERLVFGLVIWLIVLFGYVMKSVRKCVTVLGFLWIEVLGLVADG